MKEILEIWKGKDNKLSIRRIFSTMSFLTYLIICIYSVIDCKGVNENIVWSLLTASLSLLGLTTVQNMIDVKIGKKEESFEDINLNEDINFKQ